MPAHFQLLCAINCSKAFCHNKNETFPAADLFFFITPPLHLQQVKLICYTPVCSAGAVSSLKRSGCQV